MEDSAREIPTMTNPFERDIDKWLESVSQDRTPLGRGEFPTRLCADFGSRGLGHRLDHNDMDDFHYSNTRLQTNWSGCATAVRDYDRRIVRSWHQELDTLLVFAALFSAIVTAFLVESTKIFEDEGRIGSHAIIINTFWLCSLILSINSVLVTILLKQWLAEYSWDVGASVLTPKQSFALRHLRFQQLQKWHIPAFIDYLPLLLIIAVLLFYAGLVAFIWTLHPVTAGIGTSLIGVATLIFICTTIIPSWSPLSPYQSSQAWLSYSFARFIRRLFVAREEQAALDANSTPGNWVDHGIHAIRSRHDTEIEFQGLSWIQRSLGPWEPKLIQRVFACALSLTPESTRAPIVCSLYIQHIPKSVLNSEDPEVGFEFASTLGNTLEPDILQLSFTVLHRYLSNFLDSEKQFLSPVSIDAQVDGIQVLLILVRLRFSEKIVEEGWTLLFELVASNETPGQWGAIRRKVFSTFLDDLLLGRVVDDSYQHRARIRLSWKVVQTIRTLERTSSTAFNMGSTADEELEWVLTTSCILFRLASCSSSDDGLASMETELVSCWDNMMSYLKDKLDANEKDDKIAKAISLWTQILCYRPTPKQPYRVVRLFNTGDPSIDNPIRTRVQALLEVLFVAAECAPQPGDVKDGLRALRLLSASDAQSIMKSFLQDSDSALPYSTDNRNSTLAWQTRGLCPDEMIQIGWLLVKEFPPLPWGDLDVHDNYQHFLLICVILCQAGAATVRPTSEVVNSKLVQRCCLEASKTSLCLLVADEEALVFLDKHQRERLEAAILALLRALATLVLQSLPPWEFSDYPYRNKSTELEGEIGALAFATLLKVIPKDRPRLVTTLAYMSQWRFTHSEPWSDADLSELCGFVESMTAFLEQPKAKECLMVNDELDVGWFEPILAMISTVISDRLSRPTKQTCRVFITFIYTARKFGGGALNSYAGRTRYEKTLDRLSRYVQPKEEEEIQHGD